MRVFAALPRPFFRPLQALALAALVAPWSAVAQYDPWALCPPVPELLPPLNGEPAPGETQIAADEAMGQTGATTTFTGDVRLAREQQRLAAERVDYDQATEHLTAEGGLRYQTPSIAFEGESAEVNLREDSGTISDVRYHVPVAHAFGAAETVDIENPDHSTFTRATYSTCPPGREHWLFSAQRIDLYRSENLGEARNVTLRLGPVPVLYLPYVNFPLEGRKSGLLTPSYGSSGRSGAELSVPYYWNIAPNLDATLTPRYMSKRGTMAMTEFRYLSESSQGAINYNVLPDDKVYGDERFYGTISHRTRFSRHWSGALDYREISDGDYFSDLGGGLGSTSTTHLERLLDLNYQADAWSFRARAQDFQALIGGAEPYRQLPQLLLTRTAGRQPYTVNADLRAEYVRFSHDLRQPTGARADVMPGFSYPMTGAAWFVTPRLSARATAYELDEPTAATLGETRLNRSLPIASIDSGLFFERDLNLAGTPMLQTLEPRLFYLYVPYRDQSDLPLFDTTLGTFSFAQLFRENRFVGADRVNDANQVTAALTTRFLSEESGQELFSASIAEIYYFRDREVVLSGTSAETEHRSDLAAELAARPNPFLTLSASARWDPREDLVQESALRARYAPDDRSEISVAYRLVGAGRESHTDSLVLWPIARQWRVLGRWYYDRATERSLDTVVGVEYESCCWSVRLAGGKKPIFLEDGALESERSIYFTLQLKGLGNLGRDFESIIRDGILGYSNP